MLFAVDRSRACRWGGAWRPLLAVGRGRAAVVPARQVRSVEESLQRFPQVQALFLDGTEGPPQRRQHAGQQRARYAGKKKRHTLTNVIGHEATKRIVLLGETPGGRGHDDPLWPGSGGLPRLPQGLRLSGERGFQGLEQAAPQLAVCQAAK